MSTGVWGAGVWLGASKAGRGVLMPEGRRLPLSLSVEQFSWLTGESLLCLTWNDEEFYTESADMLDILICVIG